MLRLRSLSGHALFVVVFALLSLAITWHIAPQIISGALRDTDDYTRLVRVRHLLETGAWFDGSLSRSNWPHGETLHWTRPLDILLVVVAAPFIAFLGLTDALHLAALIVPPVVLLGICYGSGWTAATAFGSDARWLAMIAMLAQPAILSYGHPGRVDHHVLIMLFFMLALGASVGALSRPDRTRWAGAAGVFAGLGLWTSTEFLLALAVFLLVPVVLWIRSGPRFSAVGLIWTSWFALTTAAALIIERGPGLATVEYQRLALPHAVVAVLALSFWLTVAALERRGRLDGQRERLTFALVAAATCFGLMAWAFPPFFRGPMAAFDHPVVRFWLSRVSELQPTLMPDDRTGLGLLVFNAGALVVIAPYLVVRLLKSGREGDRGVWAMFLLALSTFVIISLFQIRWITYVQLLLPPLLAKLVVDIRARLEPAFPAPARILVVGGTAVALFAGPLVAGASILPADSSESPSAGSATTSWCDFTAVARHLASEPSLSAQPLTVAAMMDAGPPILYFTSHRVLAAPYGNEGIVAVHELLNATRDDRALALMADRQVDLVLLCPAREGGFFHRTGESGEPTLYGRLLDGTPPPWLEAVPLPDELQGAHLFRHVEAPGGPASPSGGSNSP